MQIAASTYRIVPHEATGISLFLMLYGREATMPEEIEHTLYASNTDDKKAVAGYIAKFLNMQKMASKNNERKIQKSKNILIGNMLRNWVCICSQLAIWY